MTTIDKMTKKEMLAVKFRERFDTPIECTSFVIIPGNSRDLHDSGYRRMYYLAAKDYEPIALCGGGDVFHLGGIGGFNIAKFQNGPFPDLIKPVEWDIDCLPKSGLLNVWCRFYLTMGADLSSMEVFADTNRMPR